MADPTLQALTILDYEDRELLHILDRQADGEGWASTEELAEVIRIQYPRHRRNGFVNGRVPENARHRYAMACIARRYSYMANVGWVERGEEGTKRVWRITPMGRALMAGALTAQTQRTLASLGPGERVLLMRSITEAYREASHEERTMVRRQFQHGTYDRRRRTFLR